MKKKSIPSILYIYYYSTIIYYWYLFKKLFMMRVLIWEQWWKYSFDVKLFLYLIFSIILKLKYYICPSLTMLTPLYWKQPISCIEQRQPRLLFEVLIFSLGISIFPYWKNTTNIKKHQGGCYSITLSFWAFLLNRVSSFSSWKNLF